MSLRTGWLGFLLCICLPAAPAMAASDSGSAQPALHSTQWRIECDNSGKALDCQTINRIVTPNGDTVATIAIHPLAGAGKTIALVQVPFGIAFGTPVQLSVKGAPVTTLTLNTCLAQGCIATGVLSDAFIAAAIASSKLTLSFGMDNNKNLALALPLEGFGLAYHFMTQK
jgi:invasion protein IalB